MPSNSWFSSGDGEAMDMEEEPCEHVDDIAKQLVMNNKKIKVIKHNQNGNAVMICTMRTKLGEFFWGCNLGFRVS